MSRRRWEEIFNLNQVYRIRWERRKKKGKKKKEKKRKRKESRVRSSTFSLRSKEIGSSVFRRNKRQSSSTRRELRVSTRTWGFRQTPRGRGFSPTLVFFF